MLGEVRAMVRAEVFNALEEEVFQCFGWFPSQITLQELTKPPLSNENVLINELIREYLEFNKLNHTLSVLLPGSDLCS